MAHTGLMATNQCWEQRGQRAELRCPGGGCACRSVLAALALDARPCWTLAGSLCHACSSLGGHLRSWRHGCHAALSCACGDGVLTCFQSPGDRLPQHREPLYPLCQLRDISCPSPPGPQGWVTVRISCHSTFCAPNSCLTSSQELGWKQQVLCVTYLAVYV